jgi:hypothetical protein
LLIVPERKIAIAMLTNVGTAPFDLALAVLAECLGLDPDTALPAARLRSWTERISGEYRMYLGQSVTDVGYDDGLVTVQDRESGKMKRLVPAEDFLSSGLCFHYDNQGGRTVCQFVADADAPVLYIDRNRFNRVASK